MKASILASALMMTITILMLSACGGSSRSSAGPSPSSLSNTALAVPQNVVAVPANGSVTLNWSPVSGALGYNIYFASEASIIIENIASFNNGMRIQNVRAPYTINSLINGESYYFVVTAINNSTEGRPSVEVPAVPTAIDLGRQPTAQEVLVVELVNRARANPEAEAMRYGIGLNDGINGAPITATPKQPLAHNLFLIDSARNHSQWMLDEDIFSHTGAGNSAPTERMAAAGYVFSGAWSSGENIAWGGTSASSINLTSYAQSQHQGLFESPGHRVNILGENFRELGVGQKQGYFIQDGVNYMSSMLTQNFARSGSSYYLTGVIYNDVNNNNFYDVGEGLSEISISIDGKSYPVYAAGAYTIPVKNGRYDLTITGSLLGATVYHSVHINNANIKLDVIKSSDRLNVVSW